MDFSQSLFSCCILATLSNIVEIHWCFTQILFAFTAKDFSSILPLFRLSKLNFLQNTFFQCTKQTCCEIWVHKTLYKETISHISTQHCSCWTWFSVTDAAVESAQPSFCTARCLNLVTPNLPPWNPPAWNFLRRETCRIIQFSKYAEWDGGSRIRVVQKNSFFNKQKIAIFCFFLDFDSRGRSNPIPKFYWPKLNLL